MVSWKTSHSMNNFIHRTDIFACLDRWLTELYKKNKKQISVFKHEKTIENIKKLLFYFGNIFQMAFRPTLNCSIAKTQKLGER